MDRTDPGMGTIVVYDDNSGMTVLGLAHTAVYTLAAICETKVCKHENANNDSGCPHPFEKAPEVHPLPPPLFCSAYVNWQQRIYRYG